MRIKKHRLIFTIIFVIFYLLPIVLVKSDYTKQTFTIQNENRVLLDLDTDGIYNGSISVTLEMGDTVTAKVNGVTKTVAVGESKLFEIYNVSSLTFSLSSSGTSQGYFELDLNIDYYTEGNRTLYIILAVFGGLFFIGAAISYYYRSKQVQTSEEEEEEEFTDPETLKKRKEAAGAEKRFWGLKDE